MGVQELSILLDTPRSVIYEWVERAYIPSVKLGKRLKFDRQVIDTWIVEHSKPERNALAKDWGGTARVDLPSGTKLINVTWKDADLWYLVRCRRTNEVAESYTFIEKSELGVFQGTVVLEEH